MNKLGALSAPAQTTALCLLSFFLTSTAFSQAQREDAQVEKAVAALERLSDADSLAAAGLLSSGKPRSLVLIGRASAASANRPELLWLQVEICRKAGSCDPAPFEARLREVDPSNAAGWLSPLRNEEQVTDAVLAAIGPKERFDTYFTTLVFRLSEALIRTHTMTASEAAVTIIGFLAAQSIPAYTAASKACKGERLEQAAVKVACRGIANAFEQGDTYIAEMIGASMAKRVWPEDSLQWTAAAEARRVYEYRSKLFLELQGSDVAQIEKYLTLCSTNRREQDVYAAVITAAGKELNPPPIAP